MHSKTLLAGVAALLVTLGHVSSAAADSLTASATPAKAGTAEAPTPVELKLAIGIDTDAAGVAHHALTRAAFSLPADFASNVSTFGSCSRDVIATALGPGKSAPPCPTNSVLGSGFVALAIPAYRAKGETQQVILYNNGGGLLTAWMRVKSPDIATSFTGALSSVAAPFGAVVTWDFSRLATSNPAFFISRFEQTLSTQAAVTSTTTIDANKAARDACIKKAKRKYPTRAIRRGDSAATKRRLHRNRKRRDAAIRACRKRYPKKPETSDGALSAFASTGCGGGSWPLRAELSFKDAPPATLDQKVSCTK